MKRGVIFLIFGWLVIFSSQGQWYNKYYGKKNLSELSQQELMALFQKSRNLKNFGKVLTIGGIAGVTVGSMALIILSVADIMSSMSTGNSVSLVPYDIFMGLIITGTVAMIGGIPIWIAGHIRNKKIDTLMNHRISGSVIHLNPLFTFNQIRYKYSPGISISFRF